MVMRRLILIIIFILPGIIFSQEETGVIRTSIVLQRWDIEDIDDSISEGTMPIEITYPVLENMTIQLNHFPAFSKFGEANMAGISDTWIRGAYSFTDYNLMMSFGIGLPTGKTELDSTELILARLLSEQSFKFQLPVYGQGLTLSGGVLYAYSFNDYLSVGAGFNFVYRGKYKYSEQLASTYDPGEQLGINVGLDYFINENLKINGDFVYNYYMSDKLNNKEIFMSGPRFMTKIGFRYQQDQNTYWLEVLYQAKAKNEIYSLLDEKLIPEPQNSNITIRELNLGGKFSLTDNFYLSVIGEVRSYVENEYRHGWADLGGGGFVGEYSVTDNLAIFSGTKIFFGDGEIYGYNPKLQGFEFYLGSQWKF